MEGRLAQINLVLQALRKALARSFFHPYRPAPVGINRSTHLADRAVATAGRAMFATIKDHAEVQLSPLFGRIKFS